MVSIGIIDNDNSFLNSSIGYLKRFANVTIDAVYTSFNDFKNGLSSAGRPDVFLIDHNMIELDGIELIKRMHSNCSVILLSDKLVSSEVIPAIKVGISGYMVKSGNYHSLYDAIMVAFTGGCSLGPDVAKILMDFIKNTQTGPAWDALTKRENEFARELLNGATYKQISDRLFVSFSTVSFHVQNIYLKLQVKSRTEFLCKFSGYMN